VCKEDLLLELPVSVITSQGHRRSQSTVSQKNGILDQQKESDTPYYRWYNLVFSHQADLEVKKKVKNIQQLGFANGHPLNY
jgi:hypothetical protein